MKDKVKSNLKIYGPAIQQHVIRDGCQTTLKDLVDGRLQLDLNDGNGLQITIIFEKDLNNNI